MKVSELYKDKKKTLSFEIVPPEKNSELSSIDETLDILCELNPDFISVTFGAGGSENCNSTIEVARKIKEKYNIEPVVHLTCLNYSKDEIDLIAKQLQQSGVQNILALRGDKIPNVQAKNDFKYASDLIAYMKSKYDFCFLGACYPEGHPESESSVADIKHLKEKVNSGAEVLLSQLFFDNNYFYDFQEKCKVADIDVPIIAGIMPAISKSQLEKMVSLCGVAIPTQLERIVNKFGSNKDSLFDAGMSYGISQIIDLLASDVDGVHIYTMNNPMVAKRISSEIHNFIK